MKKLLGILVLLAAGMSGVFADYYTGGSSGTKNGNAGNSNSTYSDYEDYKPSFTFEDFMSNVDLQLWVGGDICLGLESTHGFAGAEFGINMNYQFFKCFYGGIAGGLLIKSLAYSDGSDSSSDIIYGTDDKSYGSDYDFSDEPVIEGFITAQLGMRFDLADFVFRFFGEAGYFDGFPGAGLGLTFQYGSSFGYFGSYAVDWCPNEGMFVDRFSAGVSIHF